MSAEVPSPGGDLIARIRDFIDRELIPLETEFLRSPPALEPRLNALRDKVKQAGLWALALPKAAGGQGLPLTEFALVSEQLGRTPTGHYVFGVQAPDIGNAELLHLAGTAEQKQRYLQPLVAGKIRSCFAMTEPHTAGANPLLLAARAVRDGDHYVINGHKWFCSSAEGAAFAIVMAVTDPDAPPHQRASMFIAPTDAAGWTFVRNIPVMGEACGGYFAHAEIKLEDLRVPASMRLGAEGAGFLLAQERLGPGRIHHCMRWLGICARAQEELCKRALTREIAPGKRLADTQIVQTWIAENAADIACSRALVLQVAGRAETQGFKAAREDVSIIKFQVAGSLQRVLDRTLQAHGALGMTDDAYVAFAFRHERAARIYDGPDEVHKLSVARQILKRYRQP
ncbi:MAG: acyl-CoA dehydrogenase family protein [Gammaproteobacteria bacterium]|nr:acyl-CoA dehydrogenase family protein [Gammaproteobacteria bacterium]